MQRISDGFLSTLEKRCPLEGKSVLEIGSGDGARSVEIAKRCALLVGVEPNGRLVAAANRHTARNAIFFTGSAEHLPTELASFRFDIALFSLSFHHVPAEDRPRAIGEAMRLTSRGGRVVFFEPGTEGSFFEAEIEFDACDGDERVEKQHAYEVMRSHSGLVHVAELWDETTIAFDSVEDFIIAMNPKRNLDGVEAFLQEHNYQLAATRRINIFRLS